MTLSYTYNLANQIDVIDWGEKLLREKEIHNYFWKIQEKIGDQIEVTYIDENDFRIEKQTIKIKIEDNINDLGEWIVISFCGQVAKKFDDIKDYVMNYEATLIEYNENMAYYKVKDTRP